MYSSLYVINCIVLHFRMACLGSRDLSIVVKIEILC